MKIKLEYFEWFDNKPVITEFEGTFEEFEKIKNLEFFKRINLNQRGEY